MRMIPTAFSSIAIALIMATANGPTQARAKDEAVTIDDIQVRLFKEISGTLSKNVAPPTAPALWNTIIGEGDAEEPANDFLISVFLSGPAGKLIKQPLVVTVTRTGQKTAIAKRRFESLLFGSSGKATKPVFVTNATCAPVTIAASTGSTQKSANIDFRCGE